MSRGYVRDRGSCLNRPDREEENLYKKLPRILSGDAARGDAWLMGSSVLTAILVRKTEEGRKEEEETMTGVESDVSYNLLANASASSRGGKRPHDDGAAASDEATSEGSVILARPKRRTRREEPCPDAEKAVEVLARAAEESRRALGLDVGDPRTADALTKQVAMDIDLIDKVATRSSHLKGTFVRVLKDAAASIMAVTEALKERSASEEVRKLQAENKRLRSEMGELKSQIAELLHQRTECTTLSSSQKDREELVEELRASMIGTLGRMMDAKLAGIEERLLPAKTLRPPLAADKRKEAAEARKEAAQKPKKKKSSAPKEKAPASNDESDGGEWVTVVKKTKKKSYAAAAASAPAPQKAQKQSATKKQQPQPQSKRPRQKKAKLAAPRTPAVLVTLRPEAVSKGVTYCQVLQTAAEKVNLAEVGIEGGLKMRIAATGARLLELPKGQAPEVVERFTRELRTALDDVANVVQPTKYASIRITGLDDSVTPQMVVDAVAKAGQTVADNVKAGDVSVGPGGMGVVVARCPIAVAKSIANGGRLLVGWSSARVQVLEQRALRCFKCMGLGHTRPTCPTAADRGKACYRCGMEGHLARACTGALRCAVCADAGKPASHLMGGRDCRPPKTKGRVVIGAQTAAHHNGSRQAAEEVAAMSS
ncbi:unnamed protein product [Euphydryas editha]|uniref:CCHC-type domain-containing protein n=1 Tax=Euphydryas editha TaxID=104508 RepID=A0AAU9TDG8_EUPED|nr:unnamed protein product [Euphydryas editha]